MGSYVAQSVDVVLAGAFLSTVLDEEKAAYARAIVSREARRRDSMFVKVTSDGEVFFHGQIGERENRHFYFVADSMAAFAGEIARRFAQSNAA